METSEFRPPFARALFTEAAVRRRDAELIEAAGGDPYVLMQRAAWAALEALKRRWPRARSLAIACGPGNNGGDGWVLARLAEDAGYEAWVVHLAVDAERGSTEARRARADFRGRRMAFEDDPGAAWDALGLADVVVDAVFGIGLSRAAEGAHAELIEAINAANRPVLALDLPSGLAGDSGAAPGIAVRADLTVQFVGAKRGAFTGRGRALCGRCEIAPLLDPALSDAQIEAAALAVEPEVDAWALPAAGLAALLPRRPLDAHKGDHGHVLVLGGEQGMAGAVLMAARAALRGGAGLVSVGTRAAHAAAVVAAQPELMVSGLESAEALAPLMERADVLALGPGLGRGEWGRALFARALMLDAPRVCDADALNLLAEQPQALSGAVITPHPGEAGRLLGCSAADINADRFGALERLVERFQCVVVLKGAGSLVGAPGRRTRVIDAGNPGMATGGMGDLLTGVIAALLAQGLAAFDAACAGALAHAAAGDLAARDGQRGLLPSDLLEPLRRVLNPRSEEREA
jgi:ADP-dependent NAD(P)H-hydrate dehydratase / NAD(P)H-hydrate epimerase